MSETSNDEDLQKLPSWKRLLVRLELVVMGIVFSIWNNVSTIINAKTLLDSGHTWAAALTLFFLMFPGLVICNGLWVLQRLGHRPLGSLATVRGVVIMVALLLFFPVIPTVLYFYALLKNGKHRSWAKLCKLFQGFLDDGPQFVLRLVICVLFGIGIGRDRDDIIFILSMVTSFGALVYFGLQFNERKTRKLTKWFICFPMFAASLASRAFTLAVFLKETTLGQDAQSYQKTEWIAGLGVVLVYCVLNILTFRWCGQDIARSVVFGLSSTLIPAGYNNDAFFYQMPHQPIAISLEPPGDQNNEEQGAAFEQEDLDGDKRNYSVATKMRSAAFLVLHTMSSTALLSSCAAYILLTRAGTLSQSSDSALILPQILAVVPGCFFTLSRSVLLLSTTASSGADCRCANSTWKVFRIVLATLFALIAYASIIPAIVFSVIWKLTFSALNVQSDEQNLSN